MSRMEGLVYRMEGVVSGMEGLVSRMEGRGSNSWETFQKKEKN